MPVSNGLRLIDSEVVLPRLAILPTGLPLKM